MSMLGEIALREARRRQEIEKKYSALRNVAWDCLIHLEKGGSPNWVKYKLAGIIKACKP